VRDVPLPVLLGERLRPWREAAAAAGLPTGPDDFIIPGAARWRSNHQPGGHVTDSQERRWGSTYLQAACRAVAKAQPERAHLADATAYAARRGHISSRLASGERVPAVADDCGTSRKTITGRSQARDRAAGRAAAHSSLSSRLEPAPVSHRVTATASRRTSGLGGEVTRRTERGLPLGVRRARHRALPPRSLKSLESDFQGYDVARRRP
jgi:hypothetical protein